MKQSFAPQLVALTEGDNLSLDKPIILIGRHQECDIQIASRKISRRHCCLAQVGDHLVIRDLGSTNGIRINGVKVVEGNLQPDDELTIGNMRYKLIWTAVSDKTVRENHKNGVKAGPPKAHAKLDHDQSYDVPIAIDENGVPIPMLQSKPHEGQTGQPMSLEIPDKPDLIPLVPPRKS